jgi:multidrug efflux pump subunit AcrB
VTQILNFGAPAPIDVVVTGNDLAANEAYANKVAAGMAKIAGIADVRLQQPSNYPELQVNVDRARADRIGITENDITKSLSVNLAGSSQVSPTFWLNPKTGVSYPIVVQAPTYNADSVSDLNNVSITGTGGYQTLNQVTHIVQGRTAALITHYSIKPAIDVYATTQGRPWRRGSRHQQGAGGHAQ